MSAASAAFPGGCCTGVLDRGAATTHRLARSTGKPALRRPLSFAPSVVGALALLGFGGLGFPPTGQARPVVPAENRDQPYSGLVKVCEDPAAVGYIQGAFAARELEYWHSGLTILGFQDVREIGFRSNGLDYIPRRYCQARAIMSDNKVRSVSYLITEAGGSIGFTDNVVWCVVGLDRNDAFAPGCREAQP